MPYWSFVFWGLVLGFSPVLSPFLIQFSPVLDFLFGSARFLPVNQDWSGFSIVFNANSPVLFFSKSGLERFTGLFFCFSSV